MARRAISLAEEEGGAGGGVSCHCALYCGRGAGANKRYQLLQLLRRELECGHASSRDPSSDQFAQVIRGSSERIFSRDNVRPALSSLTIRAVTCGAARLEMTLPCIYQGWQVLQVLQVLQVWIARLGTLRRRLTRCRLIPDQRRDKGQQE